MQYYQMGNSEAANILENNHANKQSDQNNKDKPIMTNEEVTVVEKDPLELEEAVEEVTHSESIASHPTDKTNDKMKMSDEYQLVIKQEPSIVKPHHQSLIPTTNHQSHQHPSVLCCFLCNLI